MVRPRIVVLALAALVVVACFAPGCDDLITEITEVTIAGNPTADFAYTPDSGCVPLTVTFQDRSSGPIDEWFWDFGDGDTLTVFTDSGGVTHVYDSTGRFTVTLTVYNEELDGSDHQTYPKAIDVGHNIDSVRVLTDSVCQGDTMTFRAFNPVGVNSWVWNFGDNIQSFDTATVQYHVYAKPGPYEVSLQVSGDCGMTTLTDSVTVLQCAKLGFDMDFPLVCVGTPVEFSADPNPDPDSIVIESRLWEFGDGETADIPAPSHEFEAAGTYHVTLTTTVVNGGSYTYEDSVIVFDGLSADFTAIPTTDCFSAVHQFQVQFESSATGRIDTLIWDFGDGTQVRNDSTPVHAYLDPGRYSVSLTIYGCQNEATSGVTKSNLVVLADDLTPAFSMSKDTIDLIDDEPPNRTITFTDLTTGVVIDSIFFNFGDGDSTTVTSTPIAHIYDTLVAEYEVSHRVYNRCGWTEPIVDTVWVIDTTPTE